MIFLWLFLQTAEAATSRSVMASALTTFVKGLQPTMSVLLVKNQGEETCYAASGTALWTCDDLNNQPTVKNITSSALMQRWGYK